MRTDQITVLILDMFQVVTLRVDQVTILTLGLFGVVTLGVLSRSLYLPWVSLEWSLCEN